MRYVQNESELLCLNHGWRFIEKDFSVLPPEASIKHDAIYRYAKAGAQLGPASADFDDGDWSEVSLPHDWVPFKDFTPDAYPNHGYKKRGIGWYRIKFQLPESDMNRQILLDFEGMSCDSQIYFNGQLLYRNFSGYKSFTVDLTDMANFGDVPNVLAVRVDASAWEGWWYEGAGIYRSVWLHKKAAAHIAHNGIWARPVFKEGRWTVEIETTVENSFEYDHDFTLETALYAPCGSLCGTAVQTGTVKGYDSAVMKGEIAVEKPELWSIDTPNLYRVKARVSGDFGEHFQCVETGLRTIRYDADEGFFLNGENVKMRGFCNHQDHAGVGAAVPYAIKEYRIALLKKLGANAYRCAHNTDPEILEICDRQGMLVMEENRTFSSAEDNLLRLESMIKNSRNHPSVVMYSMFNEEPLQGTRKGHRMAGRMQALVHRLDDSRPCTGAFNGGQMEDEGAATILDIVGINYNPASYDAFHAKFPKKPVFGSETASAFMVRGEWEEDRENRHIIPNYDETCAPWGNTIHDTWESVDTRPFNFGSFVWTGFDYRGEPTPFTWPSVATFFGTYDSCGFEKDGCFLYKAYWHKEPVLHLLPHWNLGLEKGTPVRVMAFTNCDEAELFLNGKSMGRKACGKYRPTEFTVPYEAGKLSAIGYRDGAEVVRDAEETTGDTAQLRVELSKTALKNDGLDALAVNVRAYDEKGRFVPTADDLIHFDVTGGAKLIGVGNGDPNSHEDDVAPYRRLYNGCAQAILLNDGDEDIRITVHTEKAAPVEMTVPVVKGENAPYVKAVRENAVDNWTMFHSLFDEMPDPNPTVAANDMNSFEPVAINGVPQPQFKGRYKAYGLYRVSVNLGAARPGRSIYFSNLAGEASVYLDGAKLAGRAHDAPEFLNVPLPDDAAGAHILTVVIRNMDEKWSCAGLLRAVSLRG